MIKFTSITKTEGLHREEDNQSDLDRLEQQGLQGTREDLSPKKSKAQGEEITDKTNIWGSNITKQQHPSH